MKYVTACPNCGTQFLLNDELIKAYRGKVQCGNCEHVFNAKNRLTEVADEISSTDEDQAYLEDETATQTLISEEAMSSDDVKNTLDDIEPTQSLPTESAIEKSDAKKPDAIASSEVDYYISSPTDEIELESQPDLEEKSVNLDAIFTNKHNDKKLGNQYTLLIKSISFLLFIILILQSIYFLRNDIARQFPVIKPLLERVCIPLKCTIDLAKHVDFITIGDSDMQEDDLYQSVIKFSSSIKNNARYPQAYPNIELTLTDSDDRAVITKLITPKSYLDSIDKIKQGLASQETAAVRLSLHVNDSSVASYRILLFY